MAIITTYPDDTAASDGDKYLTVDESGATRLTSLATLRDGVLTPGSVDSDTLAQSARPQFKIGVIEASTLGSTGNKSITGVGFTPKLVKFFVMPTASTAAILFGEGVMTQTAQRYIAGIYSGQYGRNSSTTACIAWISGGSTTPSLLASYVSMDADGFTINVSVASNTFPVSYEAYA